MKNSSRTLTSLTAAILATGAAQAATNIVTEDFEDNTITYTTSTPEFHDGGSDYFAKVPLIGSAASPVTPYAGFGDSHYFAVEDMDDGNTRPSSGTITFTFGIAGYENITVGTLFAAGGNGAETPAYDSNDGFLMRARIDGNPFQNLLAFEAAGTTNQLLLQDTDFDGMGDGFQPDHNFAAYSGMAVAGTGTTLTLEIIFDANDGNSEFAIDNITVDGDLTIPEPSSALLALLGSAMLLGRRRK